jgi:hypothetical protein
VSDQPPGTDPLDRDVVHRHLQHLEERLTRLAAEVDPADWTALPASTLRALPAALTEARRHDAAQARGADDEHDYISAHPLVSIAQSTLHVQRARGEGAHPADTHAGDPGPGHLHVLRLALPPRQAPVPARARQSWRWIATAGGSCS